MVLDAEGPRECCSKESQELPPVCSYFRRVLPPNKLGAGETTREENTCEACLDIIKKLLLHLNPSLLMLNAGAFSNRFADHTGKSPSESIQLLCLAVCICLMVLLHSSPH
jgi:hypothetical protein